MKKEIKKQIQIKKKQKFDYIWVLKITILAFLISIIFSIFSETFVKNISIVVAVLILLLFIAIGIIFDMIGVAVACASEEPFHSMSSRKVAGAKQAVYLKKNANKVSSFCNDVIGDICGIISGSVGVSIAIYLSNYISIFLSSIIVTAIISALTIGGKAIFKSVAINRSNEILYNFAKIVSIFKKIK